MGPGSAEQCCAAQLTGLAVTAEQLVEQCADELALTIEFPRYVLLVPVSVRQK